MRHLKWISLQFVIFHTVISTLTIDLSSCFHNRLVCTWRIWDTIHIVFVYMRYNFDRWDTSVSEKYCSVQNHSTGGYHSTGTEEESCKCCATATFLPGNMTFQGQSCTSDFSSDEDSNILEGSGSMYFLEEDVIEPDESESLYDDDSSCTSKDKRWMMNNEQWTMINKQQNKLYSCSSMPTLIGEALQMYLFTICYFLQSHLNTHILDLS